MENTIKLNRAIIANKHIPIEMMARRIAARVYISSDPFLRLLNLRWKSYYAKQLKKSAEPIAEFAPIKDLGF